MIELIDRQMILTFVSAVIYLSIVAGVLILIRKKIEALVDLFRSRYRLRSERSSAEPALARLDRLLKATMKKPISSTAFCALTIVLFFTVFIAC